MNDPRVLLTNISLCLTDRIHPSGALLFSGTKIEAVLFHPGEADGFAGEVIDGEGLLAAPAYIDTHCHGGDGADCNDGTTEAVEVMGRFYRGRGIAAYLPSTSSDPLSTIEEAFSCIRRVRDSGRPGEVEILGAHMEGPFINPVYRGCQGAEHILEMTDEHFAVVLRNADLIRRITLAPEIPANHRRLSELAEMGIVISIGHSAATYAQVLDASQRGATMVTHLFNAMSSTRKDGPFRICGVQEAALTLDGLYAEIIADGRHLPPELMKIAVKCKGPDRLLLCSDANRAAGGAEGGVIYTCGQEAIIEDGVCMLADRSGLASSTTPIDQMVRNMVTLVDVPVCEAVRMASANPAAMLGVSGRKGTLAPGRDADVILLDPGLFVRRTFCRGR